MSTSDNTFTQIELKSAIIRNPLIVAPETMVMDAIAKMSGEQSPYVLVAENEQLLGVFTEQDVVKLLVQQKPLDRLMMREVMVHPVITLREADFTNLSLAINLLQKYHIRQLPIVDNCDLIVGLVTYESLHQDLNILAEESLQESETRFRRVFESNIVGMMFTDFDGQITDANDRFLEMLGYSREDMNAKHFNWTTI
ncbi:MAG: PAS domain S-box protein, partial [Pseudanabaena sp. CAN_BIN31]|nr:PAS domain S-box protein [Pseudanabaena sp. CAN_BIN31]